jgi:hypothetical protein
MVKEGEGGCACGETRYKFSGDPLTCYACHCSDCQRRSGAAFTLTIMAERSAVKVVDGAPVGYEKGPFAFHNCPTCGSRLWAEYAPAPDICLLVAGTLDDTSWIQPVAH